MISDWTTPIKLSAATGLALLIATETAVCFAQTPPPNDELTNRIALTGATVVWNGNTAGGTENLETDLDFYFPPEVWWSRSYHSVWWSWNALESSPVLIEKLGDYQALNGFVAVYWLDPSSSFQVPLCAIELYAHGQYATFHAEAGREYVIRLNLEETNDVAFRITATNAPIFRLQPRTQTVSSNASVLFTAWAFGVKPLVYQWRHNGTDVPNATNAMFPIYSANATNAGEYYVVVSSAAGGTSTSLVARLIVSTNDPLPAVKALRMLGGRYFEFAVTGEEGRSYLVETSTNLIDWPVPATRQVVNNTNQTTQFQLFGDAPRKFIHLVPYHPKNEICNSNLKQFRFAVWQFAEDQHKHPEAVVTGVDLLPRFIGRVWPHCPLDLDILNYSYYPQNVNSSPVCVMGHILEEP